MSETPEQDYEEAVDEELEAFIDDAIERTMLAPATHPCAMHQGSFKTVNAVLRYVTAYELSRSIEEFRDIPYGLVDDFLFWLCQQGLTYGAKLFAALTRSPEEPPAKDQVVFSEIWYAMHEALEFPESEIGKAFASAINQIGPVHDVLARTAWFQLDEPLQLHPAFESHKYDLVQLMYDNELRGAAAEFCYVRLMSDQFEMAGWFKNMTAAITGNPDITGWFKNMTAAITGNPDITDLDNLAKMSAIIGMPDTILPWPEDLQCFCGKSLKKAIYCCDPDKPIDIDEFKDQLDRDFIFSSPCCGEIYEGFRCDACSRVYSWRQGIVGTLTGYSRM
jgi:hypothetical protein